MTEVRVTIVVAMSVNGVIGRAGGMPWHLPSDLKRFKALTLGKPVVMGRKTFASIGRLLPGRPNIIVSRDPAFEVDGASVVATLSAAIAEAKVKAIAIGTEEICIIGGGEIYAQAIDLADRLEITEVMAEIAGDTRFPAIDPAAYERIFDEAAPLSDKDSHAMRFSSWRRRGSTDPQATENGTILPHVK